MIIIKCQYSIQKNQENLINQISYICNVYSTRIQNYLNYPIIQLSDNLELQTLIEDTKKEIERILFKEITKKYLSIKSNLQNQGHKDLNCFSIEFMGD